MNERAPSGLADVAALREAKRRVQAFTNVLKGALVLLLATAIGTATQVSALSIALFGAGFLWVAVWARTLLRPACSRGLAVLWIRKFYSPTTAVPAPASGAAGELSLLRRFQERLGRAVLGPTRIERSSRRLQISLELATMGWGHLITLGDRDVQQESTGRLSQGPWLSFLPLLLAGTDIIATRNWSSLTFLPVGLGYVAWERLKAKPVRLATGAYRRPAAAAVRSARSQVGAGGSTILWCPNNTDDWQHLIDYLVERVDVVVVTGEVPSNKGYVHMELDKARMAAAKPAIIHLRASDDPSLPPIVAGEHRIRLSGEIAARDVLALSRSLSTLLGTIALGRERASG